MELTPIEQIERNEVANELAQTITPNKVYVLMVGSREHNIYIEHIGNFYISGRVAQNKVAVLVDRPGRGGAMIKIILPQDEKTVIGPGNELLHSEPCVVPSQTLRARFLIDDVSVIEDPWRPMIPDSVFLKNGEIDANELCLALPAFQQYNVKGKGFVGNPDVWTYEPTIANIDVGNDGLDSSKD